KKSVPHPATARLPAADATRRRREQRGALSAYIQPGGAHLGRTPVHRLPPLPAKTVEKAPLAEADQRHPEPGRGKGKGVFPFPQPAFRTHPFSHVEQEETHPFPLRRIHPLKEIAKVNGVGQ